MRIAIKVTIAIMILGISAQIHAQDSTINHRETVILATRPVPDWFQEPQEFVSSNLPIFVINTDGAEIPDEPKIHAHMGIVYNGLGNRNYASGPFNHYDGHIGIELRGNTTQFFPKQPYNIETRDAAGENLNVSLLGFPEENDWVLRAAYIDKTFIRDPLALWMARSLGNYTSPMAHVELVLNGVYQGIYILAEKVKPDRNRVNITKMDPEDNSGDEVTGGYIYEIAKGWVPIEESLSRTEGDNRRIKYPKPDDITDEQRAYIAKYDDDFSALMEQPDFADPADGYAAWIDVGSFIDEILIQEVTRNSDGYGWSSHFHKDRLGKLRAGPAWDFDQSLANSTFMSGERYEDWLIDQTSIEIWSWGGPYPQFWLRLFYEPSFRYQLSARWFQVREAAWSTASLMHVIDSLAAHLNEAQVRNFEKWPILGVEIWRSVPGWWERNTYAKEVDYLKSYLTSRLNWIDDQLQEVYFALPEIKQTISTGPGITAYPNPIQTRAMLRYNLPRAGISNIIIYNLLGQEIRRIGLGHRGIGEYQLAWDGTDDTGRLVTDGVYLLRIQVGSQVKTSKVSVLR
ncbi:CotH kinase family protein [Candidatus Neomarinimicrobiota bacterium]